MKKTNLIFSFLVLFLFNHCTNTHPENSDVQEITPYSVVYPSTSAEWTLMFYMAADNNLEYDAIYDLNQIENYPGISNTNVNIIVLLDRIPGYSTADGDWNGTRLYWIKSDNHMDSINSLRLQAQDWGLSHVGDNDELNMADPQNLTYFVNFCTNHFPARNYSLIIWNHGGGWRNTKTTDTSFIPQNIAVDDTADGDVLRNYEISSALQGHHFNLIYLHACLMGMIETAYEYRNISDYLAASPENMLGWESKWLINFLNSSLTITNLYESMVTAFSNNFSSRIGSTFAVYNLQYAEKVTSALNNYATSLCSTTNQWWDEWGISYTNQARIDFDRIYSSTEQYYSLSRNIDLYHLAQTHPLAGAETLKSAIKQLVEMEWHHPDGNITNGNPYSSGLAVHFYIYDQYAGEYTNLAQFNRDATNWLEYIRAYESFPPFSIITTNQTYSHSLEVNESYRCQFYVHSTGEIEITLDSGTDSNDDLYLFDNGNFLSSSLRPEFGLTDKLTLNLENTGWFIIKVTRTGSTHPENPFYLTLTSHSAVIY